MKAALPKHRPQSLVGNVRRQLKLPIEGEVFRGEAACCLTLIGLEGGKMGVVTEVLMDAGAPEIEITLAGVGAGQAAGWIGVWFGHPGEDARSAADG